MSDTDPQAPALPCTWTDDDGDFGYIDGPQAPNIVLSTRDESERVCVDLPRGEGAATIARAVLAASGDTGHIVVSTEDSARAIRIRESVAADFARERAEVERLRGAVPPDRGEAELAAYLADLEPGPPQAIARAITSRWRLLPVDGEVSHSGASQPSGQPSETPLDLDALYSLLDQAGVSWHAMPRARGTVAPLIAVEPGWLTEVLAEVERLRAEADRLRERGGRIEIIQDADALPDLGAPEPDDATPEGSREDVPADGVDWTDEEEGAAEAERALERHTTQRLRQMLGGQGGEEVELPYSHEDQYGGILIIHRRAGGGRLRVVVGGEAVPVDLPPPGEARRMALALLQAAGAPQQ